MKDLLEFMIFGLVEKKEKVKIKIQEQEGETIFSLKADPSDMGKIIGKGGKIIRSLRTLLRTKAAKEGKRVQLLIEEEIS